MNFIHLMPVAAVFMMCIMLAFQSNLHQDGSSKPRQVAFV